MRILPTTGSGALPGLFSAFMLKFRGQSSVVVKVLMLSCRNSIGGRGISAISSGSNLIKGLVLIIAFIFAHCAQVAEWKFPSSYWFSNVPFTVSYTLNFPRRHSSLNSRTNILENFRRPRIASAADLPNQKRLANLAKNLNLLKSASKEQLRTLKTLMQVHKPKNKWCSWSKREHLEP